MKEGRINIKMELGEKKVWYQRLTSLGFRNTSEGVREFIRREFGYNVVEGKIVDHTWPGEFLGVGGVKQDFEEGDRERTVLCIAVDWEELKHIRSIAHLSGFGGVASFVADFIRRKLEVNYVEEKKDVGV